jgi:hypothetical protein
VELNNGGRVIASTEVFLYTDKDRVIARRLLEAFSNGRRRPLSDIEVAEMVKNVMPDVFEACVRRRLERLELRPPLQPQLHSYHPPC